MSIFKKIKQIFVKPIEMQTGKKNELVVRSSSSGKIKLGKTLSVFDNFVCLFVCKEKVLDRFTSGEHKLSIENIPAICRALKLNVPNKKGKYKNSFFADVYYLKLTEILDQKFESQQGIFVKKDKNFLGATVRVSGVYSFELIDPVLFLESLLKVYGIIRGSLAQRQLDIWVGELVDKKIEKNKCSLELLNERDSTCFEGLLEYLNKNLADVGVKITKIDIAKTYLPKNIYKKTNLIFNENFETLSEQSSPNLDFNHTNNELLINDFDFKSDIKQLKTGEEPFCASKLEEFNQNQNLETTFMNPLEFDQNIENTQNSNENFTQKNMDNLSYEIPEPSQSLMELQTKISYKKCKNCGAINSKQAKICFECKTSFLKVCQKCGYQIENGDFVCPKCKSIVI